MLVREWIKIRDEEYSRENPPDFLTHLGYVSCFRTISEQISISSNLEIKNRLDKNKNLTKKINLIKLTLKSIEGEYKTILENPDFAELCVSWISVKSYYVIFNLILILNYLMTSDKFWYNYTHEKLNKWFKEYLSSGKIKFNKNLFNTNFECCKIKKIPVKVGSNIKVYNIDLSERICQILKKILSYQIEDLKRKNNIENFKSIKNRQIRDNFLKNNNVNICEFFYWYRIKANYRDLEFLNKNIDSKKFADFYKNYFDMTINFYDAFKKLINNLSMKRFGEAIL